MLEVSCNEEASDAFDLLTSSLVFKVLWLPEHYVECLQDVHRALRNPWRVIIHGDWNDCSPLDEQRL